jgi:pentose-5-phosphate-3-epimerase
VLHADPPDKRVASIGSNGSVLSERMLESEALREAFEERAAIIEFDGGLTREDAERAAWALVSKRHRLH